MSKLMDFIWGNSMGEYGLMTIIMTILLILMSVIAIFMVILFIIYIVSVIISDPECQKSYLIETVKCIESEDSSHFIMRPIIIVPLIMTPHHSGSQSATFDYNNLKLKSTESSICNVAKVGKSYKAKIEVRTFPETATVEYGITEIVEALQREDRAAIRVANFDRRNSFYVASLFRFLRNSDLSEQCKKEIRHCINTYRK